MFEFFLGLPDFRRIVFDCCIKVANTFTINLAEMQRVFFTLHIEIRIKDAEVLSAYLSGLMFQVFRLLFVLYLILAYLPILC